MTNGPDGTSRNLTFPCRMAVFDCLLLMVMWAIATTLAGPVGNFPLNDDWAWAMTVKRMLETGTFHPPAWTGMTLVTHTVWGALFCAMFGFSFTVLRFSISLLGLAGMVGCYWLLRAAGAERKLTVMGALAFGFCPVYFGLSNTYMTDVSFAALTTLSAFFFVEALKHERWTYVGLGTLFAVAATLCRQLGLFVPLAFGAALLLSEGRSWRGWIRASLPTIVTMGSLLLFQYYLRKSGWFPDSYVSPTVIFEEASRQPSHFLASVAKNTVSSLLYLGLFLSPLFPFMRTPPGLKSARARWLANGVFLVFVMGCFGWLLVKRGTMPLRGNILDPHGMGPLTLRDTFVLQLPHVATLPGWFWIVVTVLSVSCGGLMLRRYAGLLTWVILEQGLRGLAKQRVLVFCLLGSVIYFLPLARNYLDRYLLATIPLLICGLIPLSDDPRPSLRRSWNYVVSGLILAVAAFGVMSTRDYLEWNRVRWRALNTLLEKDHIPPAEIDGGYEFNGWYLYDRNERFNIATGRWWVHDDRYLLSSGEVTNYNVLRRYEYRRLLPPGTGSIYVLIRQTNAAARPGASTSSRRGASPGGMEVAGAISTLCN